MSGGHSKASRNGGGALSSPLQAMQGQIPGVIITRQSSAPGDENWGMSLRGAVSTNSSEPLVIIDGVAYESINDMRLLNPSDIESMSFLKDGAAAIYGSRAAGGVVLITTKKGKEGRTGPPTMSLSTTLKREDISAAAPTRATQTAPCGPAARRGASTATPCATGLQRTGNTSTSPAK